MLNLTPLSLPKFIYIGKTNYDRDEVIANSAQGNYKLGKRSEERKIAQAALKQQGLSAPTGWVIRSGELLTFYNLRDEHHPLAKLVDEGSVDPIPAEDYYGGSEDQENIFRDLLRRTFQAQVYRLGIQWQNKERKFIFISLQDADKRTVLLPNSTRGGRVVYQKSRSKKDREMILVHKHLAFEASFHHFDDQWFLALQPDWFFSWNGYKRSSYHHRNVSNIKKNVHNDFVLTYLQVIHAALTREEKASLFTPTDEAKIVLGEFVTLDGSILVNDNEWLQLEAKKKKKALQMKDDLPIITGYDEAESNS